jgi:hypothetical protein
MVIDNVDGSWTVRFGDHPPQVRADTDPGDSHPQRRMPQDDRPGRVKVVALAAREGTGQDVSEIEYGLQERGILDVAESAAAQAKLLG